MNICDCKDYEKELNKVIKQAPLEDGVQTLVYNLLNDIIINKNITINKNLSLLIVCNAKKTNNFKGLGGVPDLIISSKDYNYYKHKAEIKNNEKKRNNAKFYGCVEVKVTYENLDRPKYPLQIPGDILTYGKVLYTNGIFWRYYELNIDDINDIIQEKKEVFYEKIKAVVDILSYEIKELEKEKKKLKKEKKELDDNKKEKLKKLNGISEQLFKSLNPSWEIVLFGSIKDGSVKINENKFEELKKRLDGIEWN